MDNNRLVPLCGCGIHLPSDTVDCEVDYDSPFVNTFFFFLFRQKNFFLTFLKLYNVLYLRKDDSHVSCHLFFKPLHFFQTYHY